MFSKIQRRHFVLTSESILKMLACKPLTVQRNLNPKQWGIEATGPDANVRLGQHVIGEKPSPFVSFSNKWVGSRYNGQTVFLNTRRALASGARIISGRELIQDINAMKALPGFQSEVAKLLKAEADVVTDQELLVKGYLSPELIRL